jgi:2-keto-3-deoxy-L-rhamnonate aldolase RhmA
VRAAAVRIIERAKARGLKAGVYIGELEGADFWRDVGVDFYAYSIDYKVLAKAYRAARQSLAPLQARV